MKKFFKEYWWLAAITIPVLAFVFWILHRLATGRPIKISEEVKRLTFVKGILLAVVLNFGVWGVGAVALQGDAINGKAEKDRFFLGWKGQYTEVTRETYIYSWVHTWVTIASFPLAFALLGIAHFAGKNAKDKREIADESPRKTDDPR